MEEGKYLLLWKKYLSIINILLKKSFQNEQVLTLNKSEFEATGNRSLSGYTFNLEIERGQVINDISGTAVARDLFKILREDYKTNIFLKNHKVKIAMGKNFTLKMKATYIMYYG